MIKLIASDMDGTFLSDDKTYDIDRFVEQLKFMQEKGIKFVAASGNKKIHLQEILKVPLELGFEISYVASNGAATYENNRLINASFLSNEQITKIIEWNATYPDNENNLVVLTSLESSYVSNHAEPWMIKELKTWYHDIKQVDKFSEVKKDILEVTFIWRDDIVDEHVKRLRELFGREVHPTGSGFGNVDVLPNNVNKATGLQYLQNIWKIADKDVVTFGDNENDVEMLTKYKNSFVMKNADEYLKTATANVTRLDNNHNGVLDEIDRILADL